MSLIGDLLDGVLEGTGWAAGVAIVLGVAAVGSRRDGPIVKEVMKGYIAVTDRVRELMAETGEQLQDLYAEARAEYEAGTAGPAAPEAAAAPAARRRGRPRAAATDAAAGTEAAAAPRRRGRARAQNAPATETPAAPAPRRSRRPRTAQAPESETA